jgi:hypothetical protein
MLMTNDPKDRLIHDLQNHILALGLTVELAMRWADSTGLDLQGVGWYQTARRAIAQANHAAPEESR